MKVAVRLDGWRLIPALQSLERAYAPPVSPQHLQSDKPAPQPTTVFVGGVQHRLPPAPRRD